MPHPTCSDPLHRYPAGVKYYHYPHPFRLESGEILPAVTIAYHTYGTLNAERSNCVWVMHALTANSDVADWWPHTVEKGKFLDPEENFVVCANVIGSCYGSSGPATPLTPGASPLWGDFPLLTVRDMVKAHELLAKHLGIEVIDTIIGSSLGGFQALEWLVSNPGIARKAVICATDYQCRPWLAAINKAMYMAIEADSDYGRPSADAARKGLEAARAIALLSYRSHTAYNLTQQDVDAESSDAHPACPFPQSPEAKRCRAELCSEKEQPPFFRRVHSYQAYQGKKLADRFDVYSYERMCRSSDTHDVGRGRGGAAAALGSIRAKCIVISVSSDILFPPEYHDEMAALIPGAERASIISEFAHDGFLIEHEQLDKIIQTFRRNS